VARHSKWANIKHRKAAVDRKRGKAWSKVSRAIMAAARQGGADPDANLALRRAVDDARYANMPKDTIRRLIERGAGAGAGETWENVRYEGYGPGGVAIIADSLTDNRTRTAAEVRAAFAHHGGNLGTGGCVAYLFEHRGRILVAGSPADEPAVVQAAVDAGADDVEPPAGEDEGWTILTAPADFDAVRSGIESRGLAVLAAEIAMIPLALVEVRGEEARSVQAIIDALEDSDDVQRVFTNADIFDDPARG
jgi:YebC/PmpR family DNA-binding regulatory protein